MTDAALAARWTAATLAVAEAVEAALLGDGSRVRAACAEYVQAVEAVSEHCGGLLSVHAGRAASGKALVSLWDAAAAVIDPEAVLPLERRQAALLAAITTVAGVCNHADSPIERLTRA